MNKKILITVLAVLVLTVGISLSISLTTGTANTAQGTPLLQNAPKFVCPEGAPAAECAQLELTCGKGVIDPGEHCRNCAFDAGCPSSLVCGDLSNAGNYICHYPAGLCLAEQQINP